MSHNSTPESAKLVIVIPALNEEKSIERVIRGIPGNLAGISQTEVVVVNDGSADSTPRIAARCGAQVISHRKPMGVGAAFQSGLKKALELGADIIVNIDADGQFNPGDIHDLIEPIRAGRADFVTATRFAEPEFVPNMPPIKKWGNKQVVRIVNLLTGKNFTDVSCGFRAYSREAALRLTLFGHFTYTQESFIDLAFKNLDILEVPIRVRGEREYGTSRVYSNPFHYAAKSASIMFRAGRDYKSFYFIGIPGFVIFIVGLLIAIFLLVHYMSTGQTAPYRSLVSGSGTLIVIGFLLLVISMVADMVHRNRVLIEEQLYLMRKKTYSRHDER